jgi:hypothetical protein
MTALRRSAKVLFLRQRDYVAKFGERHGKIYQR